MCFTTVFALLVIWKYRRGRRRVIGGCWSAAAEPRRGRISVSLYGRLKFFRRVFFLFFFFFYNDGNSTRAHNNTIPNYNNNNNHNLFPSRTPAIGPAIKPATICVFARRYIHTHRTSPIHTTAPFPQSLCATRGRVAGVPLVFWYTRPFLWRVCRTGRGIINLIIPQNNRPRRCLSRAQLPRSISLVKNYYNPFETPRVPFDLLVVL